MDCIRRAWHQLVHHCRQNIKLVYYLKGALRMLPPRMLLISYRSALLGKYYQLGKEEKRIIDDRLNYYCKFRGKIHLPADATPLREFTFTTRLIHRKRDGKRVKCNSVYFFDSHEYTRFFPGHLLWAFNPGDINYICSCPEITKSRPIATDFSNANNILLNLDKVRHFVFVEDPFSWEQKQSKAIFRGACFAKPRREEFIRKFGNHPLLDIRDTSRNSIFPPELVQRKPMCLYDHLKYRYIMSLEGNDVASNLKWVMSSNSIAVMPRPTCETWFMEGRLIADYHYIEIAPDFSDVVEKIAYYEAHPEECKEIIAHAHEYVAQFWNKEREDLLSLLVLDRYFRGTKQRLHGPLIF